MTQPITILLVDDHALVRQGLRAYLSTTPEFVVVGEAASGLEAAQRAAELIPDVVLMDVGMPRLDGLEATRRIRSHAWSQDMTILALTGWGQEGDREKSRDAGCDGHLVKPVDLHDLETLFTDVIQTRRDTPRR